MVKPSSGLALALVLVSASTASADASPTKQECLDANSNAQSLCREDHLAACRAQLLLCAIPPSCPALVRNDCARRLDELDRVQPTIAFEIKGTGGDDLSGVTATLDGAPWATHLEGKALSVDPGKHEFTFSVPGHAPVTRTFVLMEGEKGRRERIVLDDTSKASTATVNESPPLTLDDGKGPLPGATIAPPAARGLGSQRIVGLTLAGVGLVGVGLGVVFGSLTFSAWSNAKLTCGGDTAHCTDTAGGQQFKDKAETDGTISTVGFAAGAALLVTGGVLVLTGGHGEAESSARLHVVPAAGPGQAGLALAGAF